MLLMLLGACNSTTEPAHSSVPTIEQATLIACRAYVTTLNILTTYRTAGRLSPADVAKVDQVRPVLNVACASPPSQATLDNIMTQLTAMLAVEAANRGAH